jgi:hypothetical protein
MMTTPLLLRGVMTPPTWPAVHLFHPRHLLQRHANTLVQLSGIERLCRLGALIEFPSLSPERYVFDATILDDDPMLGSAFSVPPVLAAMGDLLGALPRRSRPDSRWLLVGGRGTGSPLHVDPIGTSAWNAVTHGCKRWCLIPPMFSANEMPMAAKRTATMAAAWCRSMHLPHLDLHQQSGEILYIPAGWAHAVDNVADDGDLTVAVTHNFLPPTAPCALAQINRLLDDLIAHDKIDGYDRATCQVALAQYVQLWHHHV